MSVLLVVSSLRCFFQSLIGRDSMISKNDVMSLATVNAPCVSIYLPTHRFGAGTTSDAHHLNSILNTATQKLRERGISATTAETTINPIRALVDHSPFWQEQLDGLAMFASPVFWRHFSLPMTVKEQLVVNDIFYLRQLVPFFHNNGFFYILALSQKSIRLFSANKYSVRQILSPEIPESMDEELWFELPQKELQFRSGGSGSALFHGHGMGDEINKERITRFFQHVDRAVVPLLNDAPLPLVLAGVDYYIPIYKSICHYNNIVGGYVEGSVERQSPEEIHAVACRAVEEVLAVPRDTKIEQFYNSVGTGLTASELPEILEAATQGRIDSLFISRDYNPVDEVNEAILNTAIRHVMTTSADIFETDDSVLPPTPVSALLRY